MYGVEVTTPPASAPLTAAELRAWLRLNDTSEDAILDDLVASAADLFEHDTGRPVISTVYRQYLARWPLSPGNRPAADWLYGCEPGAALVDTWRPGRIVLGRGGVTAVGGVYQYQADGSTTTALTGYSVDLKTPPASVSLASVPAQVLSAAGVPVSPVGYVQFTAGWADAASVPKAVRTAIRLLAAHWYENREAHRDGALAELPDGWRRVVDRYRLGVTGSWGQ